MYSEMRLCKGYVLVELGPPGLYDSLCWSCDLPSDKGKDKGKVIQLQTRCGPEGG